jgi:hypothetical protein
VCVCASVQVWECGSVALGGRRGLVLKKAQRAPYAVCIMPYLPPDIPHSEANVFVLHSLHVES